MSNTSPWLEEVKKMADVKGRCEADFTSPFSLAVMNNGFAFQELVVVEVRKFITETLGIKEPLNDILFITSYAAKLDRKESTGTQLNSLKVIRSDEGRLTAILYIGCRITD